MKKLFAILMLTVISFSASAEMYPDVKATHEVNRQCQLRMKGIMSKSKNLVPEFGEFREESTALMKECAAAKLEIFKNREAMRAAAKQEKAMRLEELRAETE